MNEDLAANRGMQEQPEMLHRPDQRVIVDAGYRQTSMTFEQSRQLQERAHALIPAGSHVYAKGDDQYPLLSPGFIVRGRGCHVWDMDGNEFIEYGMGLRSVSLGHAYPPVIETVNQQILLGSNFTRPSPIEVECAEELAGLIGSAEMVKFAKNGSDVTTAAVKLARAFTGRQVVAFCGDQPFFSADDWFIGSTPMSAGVPKCVQRLSVKFRYNDIEGLAGLFQEYPSDIACVIMEAATSVEPQGEFLHRVQQLCRDNGALFILDEIITGFRWHLGGAQAFYRIRPDLSTFGKAMANGFSVSALVGRRDVMSLGGIRHDRERVFLLSATHGAETHALAAALKTMEIYREKQVVEFLYRQGKLLKAGIDRVIDSVGLRGYFEVLGNPSNLIYATRDQEMKPSQSFRALFLQETIRRGLLMPSLVVSFSHTDDDIERTVQGIGEALIIYEKALREGVGRYLVGRPVQPVLRAFN